MNDVLDQSLPEPKAENLETESGVVSPTPKKSKKNLWIILGLVLGLCLVLCLFLFGSSLVGVAAEKAPIESVLDTFMKDLVAKDITSAYALFSPRSQRLSPITGLEKLIQGNNYVLFDGYKSLSVQNLNITAAANTNPDTPQGTVANVTGTVSYEGGVTGEIKAVLEKVEGVWKIFNINVTVPPSKFHP